MSSCLPERTGESRRADDINIRCTLVHRVIFDIGKNLGFEASNLYEILLQRSRECHAYLMQSATWEQKSIWSRGAL